MSSHSDLYYAGVGTWQERLETVIAMMRETSMETDPQAVVRAYGRRIRSLLPIDRSISLSRRGLEAPQYRITRFSGWSDEVNPWMEKERLPILEGGILGEMLFSDLPHFFDNLQVDEDDPAYDYLEGQHSLMAMPMYDGGKSLNMVVVTREQSYAFDRQQYPEQVWLASLFGRATQNLVLASQVREAYELVDRELKMVAEIQRSLLPSQLPEIPGMKLATHYQTSQRAGGDYYDFFPLRDGRWGILIADVSGHGTPAAVVMAIMHSIAHLYPGEIERPGAFLEFINNHIKDRYPSDYGTFVTAFFGIYDPRARQLAYASAGHNPPRVRRCSAREIVSLDAVRSLPLGVDGSLTYDDGVEQFSPGDQIIFYTDGITEARNAAGRMFGVESLDSVLSRCRDEATEIIDAVLAELSDFTNDGPAADDRTLVVAKIT